LTTIGATGLTVETEQRAYSDMVNAPLNYVQHITNITADSGSAATEPLYVHDRWVYHSGSAGGKGLDHNVLDIYVDKDDAYLAYHSGSGDERAGTQQSNTIVKLGKYASSLTGGGDGLYINSGSITIENNLQLALANKHSIVAYNRYQDEDLESKEDQ
jgi:hypothetical protein